MASHCTNPHVFYGDPGNHPEYVNGCPVLCSVCHVECDLESDDYEFLWHKVNGKDVCGECVECCDGGGEYLDDETFPNGVITVRFRRWEMDGKLSDAHCPQCAANWLIAQFAGLPVTDFDYKDFSKFEIASMLIPISAAMRAVRVGT